MSPIVPSFALLLALACLSGCSRESAEGGADWIALLQAAKAEVDAAPRLEKFTALGDRASVAAATDRDARLAYLAVIEERAVVARAAGDPAVASRLEAQRVEEAARFLAADPGDGFVRGLVSYELAVGGRLSEAWAHIRAGIEQTSSEKHQEERLLYFAGAVVSISRLHEKALEGEDWRSTYADLTAGMFARANSRGAPRSHLESLAAVCATAQLGAGRLDAAEKTVGAWEALAPASAEPFSIRQLIQASRPASPATGNK